jgi:radical SAM protein with 4Fe4S-binding SPASM domain
MINITKLYCGQLTPGDWLRYGSKTQNRAAPKRASERRPIIVWNITKACNLKCIHCYNDSGAGPAENELSTAEAKTVLKDLAQFRVPVVLFSGGEPLMRAGIFELLQFASELGLRTVLSTNGTLITADTAKQIKQNHVSYVGISLDGIGELNDKFRGVSGAFDKAVEGIKNCQNENIRTGLRLTLTKQNARDLPIFFDFLEKENIERACFYHLVPSGRGAALTDWGLNHAQTRVAVDTILAGTKKLKNAGQKTDILTVDNHVDGVYLYRKLLAENDKRTDDVWKLLTWNGGGLYSSGVGIGCIDFNGKVHPDQFWWHYDLGDVRARPFSEIWTDESEPLLKKLRDRRAYIKGRCRLCKFFDACGGSLRVRADLYYNDPWAPDPACYLTDDEIGLDENKQKELLRTNEIFQMPE